MSVLLKEEDFKCFPTTRYQGSKRKILPWIYDAVKELRFNTVLDVCGGTASVSYLFKKMGKSVTYNDKLNFNYQIGKALIENQRYKLTSQDLSNLTTVNTEIKYQSIIESNFDDVYYNADENKWLDLAANNIINMNHYQPHVLKYKKAVAFYVLFQACLIKRPFNLFHRKNLNLRTADVERNFGNKTSWDKSFELHISHFKDEINNLIFDSKKECIASNASIFDIDSNGYDLVYIDIPYLHKEGSNESSDYIKCYHFLEGLSKYNEWHDLIDFSTINKRLKVNDTPQDFNKENILASVEQIIYKFRNSKIVFSYKQGGIPSIEFIRNEMKKHKRKVYTISKHYKYALNRQNGNAKKNREVLIIGI